MQSSYATGDQNLKRLISDFDLQSQSFEAMIARSDEMLSGSTVAGLATEFGKIKDKLANDLKGAHTWFVWSIVALFISALPLIAFIFSPFLAMSSDDPDVIRILTGLGNGQSGWQYVGQVFARFVILLPGIWLVTFTNQRYNSLFRLQEHYSYKYSMAVSVEGFKKQSPEHADLIAALIFELLAFNPADKIGSRNERQSASPNAISAMFIDFLRKRIASADGE